MGSGPWALLAQGIQDTTNFFTGRRDRGHAERREERFYARDRSTYLKDRAHNERLAQKYYNLDNPNSRVQRLIADARKAGVHPNAALGIGMSSPVTPGGQDTYQPSPSGSYFNDGAKAGGNVAAIVADMAEAKSRTRLNNANADILEQQAADAKIKLMTQAGNPGMVPEGHDARNPQFTKKTRQLGMNISSSPTSSDAQTFEDRYGELGGSVLGLANIPQDLLYSFYKLLQRVGGNLHKGSYKPDSQFNIK